MELLPWLLLHNKSRSSSKKHLTIILLQNLQNIRLLVYEIYNFDSLFKYMEFLLFDWGGLLIITVFFFFGYL